MKKDVGRILLSASDLVGHLNCHYLTGRDYAVVTGNLKPPKEDDAFLDALRQRGDRHEKRYVEFLKQNGRIVSTVEGDRINEQTVSETIRLMKAGADIIFQAAFIHGSFAGRPDILRKIDAPSAVGDWSYEVIDTKLASETKAGTILQLSLYAEFVASVQERLPEYLYVVPPTHDFKENRYRTDNYAAYFRKIKGSLEKAVVDGHFEALYPEPAPHCEVCRWQMHCEQKRHADDHLSIVAGLSKSQASELEAQDVKTVEKLAEVPLPLKWRPKKGSSDGIVKIREQARIQVQGRKLGATIYETLSVEPTFGLCRLPQPSEGDIFFDLEGDPFVDGGGLEYLFGYCFKDKDGSVQYVSDWAFNRHSEKKVFENFIDFVIERRNQYPDFHIYHFAPYEPAAIKRMMGRYTSREIEIDELLRGQKFIDLLAVSRQAIRASVESYSIKKLEPIYQFIREQELREAGRIRANMEFLLEIEDIDSISEEHMAIVEAYNRDDCVSTLHLRDWLEKVREDLLKHGKTIERPIPAAYQASEGATEIQIRNQELISRLLADIPIDEHERSSEQHAKWLIANMIDWHQRENKSSYWEKFRLEALTIDELFEERGAIAGLTFLKSVSEGKGLPIHRYAFTPQETDIREGDDVLGVGNISFGSVVDISTEESWVDIKKKKNSVDMHPLGLYRSAEIFLKKDQQAALFRIAADIADNGIFDRRTHPVAKSLLTREAPLNEGMALRDQGERAVDAACRLVKMISGRVLAIQGPPGAGKTFTAAHMICDLVKEGKKVGVTANSHKVIRNVLDEVIKTAVEKGIWLTCIQKPKSGEPLPKDEEHLKFADKNIKIFERLANDCQVAGGTSWLWAPADAKDVVDVLFVDEAAQMSLADVLAVSQCAKSMVLLGDPQQLEQPIKGIHPEGAGASALDHVRAGRETIGDDQGIFLEKTYRLNPLISRFTSELFYEKRLDAVDGLEKQIIDGKTRISGAGLRYLSVHHESNQNVSNEEVDVVVSLVEECLNAKLNYCTRDNKVLPITSEEILIVAPYNAQVAALKNAYLMHELEQSINFRVRKRHS